MAKKFKSYGRVRINKLDWLLTIVCCVIAVGALLFSIGVSVVDAGDRAYLAFYDFARGLGFIGDAVNFGQSAVVSV